MSIDNFHRSVKEIHKVDNKKQVHSSVLSTTYWIFKESNMPRCQPDGTVVETFAVKLDDEPVLANQKRSKVSMLASDALLLVVEHMQVFTIGKLMT